MFVSRGAGGTLGYASRADYEATLRDAEAELSRAQADLANARTREARYAPLVKEDAISKQDYDDTVSQLKQAQAAVNAAVAKVDRRN